MARQLAEAAMSRELDKADPVSWAFHHSVVICYCRPFTGNAQVGKLGVKWERFDDPRLQANHRGLMLQRDEVVAHADLRWRPLMLVGPNTRLPSGVIAVRPMLMGARPVLAPVAYAAVRELCSDLLPRITTAFEELFLALYPNGFHGPSEQLLATESAPDGRGISISVDRG
jgi:hypothetical protein